jgi:thiol-disulfide isomerase/thioredoxin
MNLFGEIDGYCVAIILILLFFMYSDNQNNSKEGYDNVVVDTGAPVESIGMAPKPLAPTGDSGSGPKQFESVGLRPSKVDMEAPLSMKNSVGLLSETVRAMDNYMLLSNENSVGVNSLDSHIPTAYPRVGGDNNMGAKFDMPRPSMPMSGPIGVGGMGKSIGGSPLTDSPQLSRPMGPPPSLSAGDSAPKASMASKSLEVHMVYAPWCGWSKKSLPDFERLESEFNGKQIGNYNVSVMKHNSETSEGKAMAKKHGVKGFPTHFLIKDGEKIAASGRSFDELSSQINNLCKA